LVAIQSLKVESQQVGVRVERSD